jgi:hypothetical protein
MLCGTWMHWQLCSVYINGARAILICRINNSQTINQSSKQSKMASILALALLLIIPNRSSSGQSEKRGQPSTLKHSTPVTASSSVYDLSDVETNMNAMGINSNHDTMRASNGIEQSPSVGAYHARGYMEPSETRPSRKFGFRFKKHD